MAILWTLKFSAAQTEIGFALRVFTPTFLLQDLSKTVVKQTVGKPLGTSNRWSDSYVFWSISIGVPSLLKVPAESATGKFVSYYLC